MNAAGTYDAYICCFVGDNDTVIKMLTKKRTRLPYALPINKYEAFIYNPCVRVKDPHPELDFARADADDVNEVTAFISECGNNIARIVTNGINDVPPADIDGQNMDLDCALL